MAVLTFLHFHVKDAQGRKGTLTFRVKPAAFGATTIPTAAKIAAVGSAIFGAAVVSNAVVEDYSIEVLEDAPAFAGGGGDSALSMAARSRSEISTNNWMVSIPGLSLESVVFDPTNPNAISTSDAVWNAIRAALADADIAVSAPTGAYAAVTEANIFQTATVYDGRRSAMRAS